MSEPQSIYRPFSQEPNGGQRPLAEARTAPIDRLPEPELGCYQAIRRQYDAAQITLSTLHQALAALTAVISRRLGLGPEPPAIDPEGYIHYPDKES